MSTGRGTWTTGGGTGDRSSTKQAPAGKTGSLMVAYTG
jgi:hypothetical protein